MTGPDTSWKERAACARPGVSTALKTSMTISDPPDAAKLLCAACPVARECLRWGAGEKEFEGLAGGVVFTSKEVRMTAWTPADARALLPGLERRRHRLDAATAVTSVPPRRSHEGQFKSRIAIEDVLELAGEGLTAGTIATRLGCKVDSLYLRLHRAGRDDVWVRIREAGPVNRRGFDQPRSA